MNIENIETQVKTRAQEIREAARAAKRKMFSEQRRDCCSVPAEYERLIWLVVGASDNELDIDE